jgi:hypothetical protein
MREHLDRYCDDPPIAWHEVPRALRRCSFPREPVPLSAGREACSEVVENQHFPNTGVSADHLCDDRPVAREPARAKVPLAPLDELGREIQRVLDLVMPMLDGSREPKYDGYCGAASEAYLHLVS